METPIDDIVGIKGHSFQLVPKCEHVVVKKTVHKRNWSTKAWEPVLHARARQEAHKDEVGTCEDRSGWIW